MLAPSALGEDGLKCSGSVPSLALNLSTAPVCKGTAAQRPTLGLFSARFDGTLTAPDAGSYEFRIVTNCGVRFWIDDHIIIDSSCDNHTGVGGVGPRDSGTRGLGQRDHPRPGPVCLQWDVPDKSTHAAVTFAGRDNVTHRIEKGLHLRLEWLHYGGGPASMELLWRLGTPSSGGASDAAAADFASVPASALSPLLKPAEEWRQDLQRGLSKGWNTWQRDNAMRHVQLPSGFGVEVQLWDGGVPPGQRRVPPPPHQGGADAGGRPRAGAFLY